MLVFWVISAFLVVAALAIVLPPLVARGQRTDDSRQAVNRAVFDRKLRELDEDLKRDLIGREQFEAARADLKRTLIDDLADYSQPVFKKSGKTMAVAVLLAVPVVSVFMYLKTDNGLASLSDDFQAEVSDQDRMLTVEQAIRSLEHKLRDDPDDLTGWSMLGRSYLALGNFGRAVDAYERAYILSKGADADILVGYAEARALAAGQQFDEDTMAFFVRAVQIDPYHDRALWYAGYAAYHLHDYQSSVGYWERLLRQVPDDQQEARSALQVYLDDARQKAHLGIATAGQETGKAVTSDKKPDGAASIDVLVSLSAALRGDVADSDTLFVYARALQGPPMPLALVRMNAAALPARVTLDDTVAMIPEMTLSSMEQVEIVARISKSGQARMQAGDLYGSVQPVKTSGSSPVDIVISEVAP